ncbi:hypothetical protein B9Z55_017241 [Caenorhabditis nigoni]|uniref:Uncharacterized protein n=1 Tax=Caenorhabditis nigoni TaxID=1611254 RepID=A0A2G5T926_9PELO|nr:hypothetical protein B9Z55_017241 [Caenorhabditis nigoni]
MREIRTLGHTDKNQKKIDFVAENLKIINFFPDADMPSEEVREPFRNLPIKFISIPMDFRMDYATLDKNLKEWKPKVVICPSVYSQPVLNRPDLTITYENLWPIEFNETVKLWKMTRDKTKTVTVSVHPDVVRDLRFKQHPTKKLAIASVACNLSAFNDDFQLVPSSYPVIKKKYGKVTLVKLLRELRKRNLDPHEETTEDQQTTVLNIPILQAKITMSNGGKRMKIQSNDPTARWELQEMFNDFLMEDDGIVGRPTRDVRDVDAKEADK